MTLKNKIIAILTSVGIATGTYVIGGQDIACLLSQNQIDIGDVRLCVSDSELQTIKTSDLASITTDSIDNSDRVVTLAKGDSNYMNDVSTVLLDKIASEENSQKLDELNEKLSLSSPAYFQQLKSTLLAKYKANGGIKLDDYNIYVFVVNRAVANGSSITTQKGKDIMEGINSFIK